MTGQTTKLTAIEILKEHYADNEFDALFMARLIPVLADYERSIGKFLPSDILVKMFRKTIEYMGAMGY